MKPTLTTPNTLQIMLYAQRNQALCMASHRTDSSAITALPLQVTGKPWAALGAILEQTRTLGAKHVLIVSNVPEIVSMLTPVRFYEDRRRETEPDAHWQVNMMLCTLYPSRCAAMHAERMPKTEAAWQSIYSKILT